MYTTSPEKIDLLLKRLEEFKKHRKLKQGKRLKYLVKISKKGKHMPNPKQNWEKEFRQGCKIKGLNKKKAGEDCRLCDMCRDDIIEFIRTLLLTQEKDIVERILGDIPKGLIFTEEKRDYVNLKQQLRQKYLK
jgi:hypothetical protein